jgi:hypothetical protein
MFDYDRQQLMGHASVDMTDRYTRADRARLREGVEAITKLIIPENFDQQYRSYL